MTKKENTPRYEAPRIVETYTVTEVLSQLGPALAVYP
jgi:hypothetical protein